MTGSEIYKQLAALPKFQTQFPMLYNYGTPVKYMTRKLIGREKQLRQLKAGLLRPELCNVLLLGDAGAGKALDNNTPIPVDDDRGFVPIGELKKGDVVFDDRGNPTVILNVFPQGCIDAYQVTFEDGSVKICNGEHLWNARRSDSRNSDAFTTLTTQAMKESMDIGSADWYIPANKAVDRRRQILPIGSYAMGYIIGNKTMCCDNEPVVIHEDEENKVREFAYSIKADSFTCVDKTKNEYVFSRKMSSGVASYNITYSMIYDDVSSLDYVDGLIPERYLIGSTRQRFDLLRGLMDGGGYSGYQNSAAGDVLISFDSCNDAFIAQFISLVNSLGFRTYIENIDTECNRQRIHILCPDSDKLKYFHISARVLADNPDNYRRNDLKITSIVKLDEKRDMTCIYVDSPSHLFQAGRDYIVTHNTALVQGAMAADTSRVYLEIDISKMIADLRDNNEMAVKIKALFDESARFVRESGTEIVLFIDEFHLICMLSNAAVEALKPMLADSGTRGVRVIVATTFTEFRLYISANQPLVERLQRIEILPPEKDAIVSILKSFAKIYGVEKEIRGDYLYEQIVDLSNRYIPANSQPRKSILLLDLMCGWYRSEPGTKMDSNLLYDVLKYSEGIELNVHVDAVGIKQRLDSKVFAQYLATSAVASRLQITSADLNNKTKPMGSFLFTGSTGVGKAVVDSALIPVYDKSGKVHHKRNGELKVADRVFNREGKPVVITGVYPQGELDVYEVELTDGRVLEVNGEHIWTYKCRYGNGAKLWKNATTEELMQKMSNKYYNKGRNVANVKFVIPMNQAVQWADMKYKVDPYVMGAMIGNGDLGAKGLMFASSDEYIVKKVADLMHIDGYNKSKFSNMCGFAVDDRRFQIRNVFSEVPDLVGKDECNVFIPDIYKYGSIEQRFDVIKGLFDTGGNILGNNRFVVSYNTGSKRLAYDIQSMLYSLGISSSITCHEREGKQSEYVLYVKCDPEMKCNLFSLPRKLDIAKQAVTAVASKKRVKKFGEVLGIRDIRKTDRKEHMTCIMVDDPEHLYQAGDYIVTHNTELTKQLAEILFADPKRLIRFDMTEYSQPQSIERFRTEVTTKVWERPYSVLLFDEIEKACGDVTRILLQVLDDGRLIDQNNREVSFLNTYIVLTTNAASEIYATIGDYINDKDATDEEQIKALSKYMKVIRRAIVEGTGNNKFPPELLGRIDAICPFMPLSEDTQRKILEKRMDKLAEEVEKKHGLKISYDRDAILRYILRDKLDIESNSGGARIVATKFEEEVVIAVARIVNVINSDTNKEISRDNIIGIRVVVEGNMAVDDKTLLVGDAYVAAYPVNRMNNMIKSMKKRSN